MPSLSLLVPRLARVSRVAYGIVAMIGAAAIWGWVLGVPFLRDFGADYAAMSPAAALSMLLLATSFFALLGLSLRLLRFDIAAPLLGFSAPAAIATMLAAIALSCARPSAWLLDTLSSKCTGSVVTRWLLPAALIVPVAVGWMRLYAE